MAWSSKSIFSIFSPLEIMNINRTQAGTYTCVTNPPSPGISTNSSVEVIVQYAPEVTAFRQDRLYVPVGDSFSLSCTYQGLPPPNDIIWRLNDTVLDDSDPRITIMFDDTSTTLDVTDVRANELGNYECIPMNVVGEASATTQVTVLLPPGPVTGLTVVPDSITTTSLSLSWTNPSFNGFSDISQFRVTFTSSKYNPRNDTFNGDSNTITMKFNELLPFTNYTIELFLRNEVGFESEGVITTAKTLSLSLLAVRNLNATALSSTEIEVMWMEPLFNKSTTAPVERYKVSYSGGSSGSVELPATNTCVILRDLEMGIMYTVTVIPWNSAGEGELASKDESTNIDPPSVPSDFEGNSPDPFTVIVTWRSPVTNGGRPIVSYILQLLNGIDTIHITTSSQTQMYTFQHLQQNTTYRVRIRAVNRDDNTGIELESPIAETVTTTIPVGPPQIPDTPTISLVTNVSVKITWNDPGGYPNNYTVQIKRSTENWPGIETSGVEGLFHVQTGLIPLSSHEARVLSININGASEFSSSAVFYTAGMVRVGGRRGTVGDSLDATSGETVTLSCSLEQLTNNMRSVNFNWTRQDGSDLPALATQTGGELTIEGAMETDSGVYICSANGVEGSFTLTVHPSSRTTSVSVSVVAVITLLSSLLVFLPVGVVIGVFLSPGIKRCCGGLKKVWKPETQNNSGIYEEPYAIPLSDNEAYVIARNRN